MSKAMSAASGSQDHRGTPKAPGRVVTLIDRTDWERMTDSHPSAPPRVWGAAYHIPAPHVQEVKSYLDIREINGYTMDFRPFYTSVYPSPSSSSSPPAQPASKETQQQQQEQPPPIRCLLYIGLPSNPQFLGPQDPQALAEHIIKSRGPSGENREYLYMLDEALRELSAESGDEHVADLARRVRDIEVREAQTADDRDVEAAVAEGKEKAVEKELERVGSTDEQEEVEKVT